jgi:small-conductance mechanosensitive channel
VHSKVLATQPILSKPLAWAGQSVLAVQQASDQSLQFLEDGLAWVVGFVQSVWTWSSDQIATMSRAPWESWPLWKQVLLVIVAAAGTLIVTLPTILLAGAIALAGLWVINNFQNLSSMHLLGTFEGGDAGSPHGTGGTPPASRPGAAGTTGSR